MQAKELRRNVVLVGKEDILLMNADSSEEGRSEEEIDDEEVEGTQCMEVLLYNIDKNKPKINF